MSAAQPDFQAVVDLARHSPSVHNTQPWRFRVQGDTLELLRDDDRKLDVLDPDGRQLTVSCGSALFHARLALRLQGYDARAELAPPGEEPVLARLIAVPGVPVTPGEVELGAAVTRRHTQRGPFEDRAVTDEVMTALRSAVSGEGAWLRLLTDTEDQIRLAVVLSHAEEAESADEAYQAEVEAWTTRAEESHDGVPPSALPADLGSRHSNLRLRTFGAGDGESDEDARAEHPLAAIVGTTDDGVADRLVAGQALAHLLVRAAVDGVQASPLGQAVDFTWARQRLVAELDLVGHPQMVLRLGYALPGPDTPRRAIEDLLI